MDIKRIWLRRFSIFIIYYLVAAAVHAGVFAKWTFRDDSNRLSLIMVLDGTADRPFVYRRLLPEIANSLDRILPERLKTAINPGKHLSRIFARATDSEKSEYEFRYDVVYTLSFLSLFSTLFVLRDVCSRMLGRGFGATAAPAIFALFLPLFLTIGGYFYDLSELLFFSLAVWLGIRRCGYLLPLLCIFGTYNKESFIFFIPTLYPLLRINYSKVRSSTYLAVSVAIAAFINVAVKQQYQSNPGGAVEMHLWENLGSYLSLRSYFDFEFSYGVLTPKGLSLLFIALACTVVLLGWRSLPTVLRQHVTLAAAVDVPLSLVVGYTGELRNFSMLYVGIVCLICCAVNETDARFSRMLPLGNPSS